MRVWGATAHEPRESEVEVAGRREVSPVLDTNVLVSWLKGFARLIGVRVGDGDGRRYGDGHGGCHSDPRCGLTIGEQDISRQMGAVPRRVGRGLVARHRGRVAGLRVLAYG